MQVGMVQSVNAFLTDLIYFRDISEFDHDSVPRSAPIVSRPAIHSGAAHHHIEVVLFLFGVIDRGSFFDSAADLRKIIVGDSDLHRFVAAIPKWNYAVLILFEVMCYYKAYGERTERFDAFFLIASAALILTVLYMLYQIMRLSREESELLRQMALQKEYMESAITDDEELRRFRHDYKNHMLVVNTLLESGKTEEARSYLSAMQEPLQDAMHKIKSGNLVADTILNYKAQMAAQEQTVLHFVGHIPAEGIRSDDLCTIFSNLLDNAV